MNKVYRYLQAYLVYGFLPVVALILWTVFFMPDTVEHSFIVRLVIELLSYHLMLWFSSLIVFMIFMAFIPDVRERALRRLANLNERDEREEYITGKAARASYVATLGLTLLFLFFSLFTFSYSTLEKSSPEKPGHSIAVGFGYRLFADVVTDKQPVKGITRIIDTSSYALSSSTLLLVLLAWQLLIFNLSARKLSK